MTYPANEGAHLSSFFCFSSSSSPSFFFAAASSFLCCFLRPHSPAWPGRPSLLVWGRSVQLHEESFLLVPLLVDSPCLGDSPRLREPPRFGDSLRSRLPPFQRGILVWP